MLTLKNLHKRLRPVLRYVEPNPLRAGLCDRAEQWRWGSENRYYGRERERQALLADWPLPRPRQGRARVNRPQPESELTAIRHSLRRGTPYGSEAWTSQSAARLSLTHTLRPRGRPRKMKN